jgi:hypothetical protein
MTRRSTVSYAVAEGNAGKLNISIAYMFACLTNASFGNVESAPCRSSFAFGCPKPELSNSAAGSQVQRDQPFLKRKLR